MGFEAPKPQPLGNIEPQPLKEVIEQKQIIVDLLSQQLEEAKDKDINEKLYFKEEAVHHSLEKNNYSGIFVSANVHENEYPAGSTFKRKFIMKNDGEISWPADVKFI